MKTYWPDYYQDFKCKADNCLHTCCAGWTICIDEDSLSRFSINPDIMSKVDDGCFVLRDDGRCPFLRDDNLCQMIIDHGEDYICDICREHPRFYNFFEDHIEAGIGLVCEEACRLALDRSSAFELISEDGKTKPLPAYVQDIYDSTLPLNARLALINGGRRTASNLRAQIYAQMEVMDPEWSGLLGKIADEPLTFEDEDKAIADNELCLTTFAAYLLYRYKGAGRFAAESVYLLADLIVKGCEIHEAARLFSGEVEYSDINIDEALETFADIEETPVSRIMRMEALFDMAKDHVTNEPGSVLAIQGVISKLEEYYTGPLWKADLALDEAGQLPQSLKRGVLSEDGIYNLLERYKELTEE